MQPTTEQALHQAVTTSLGRMVAYLAMRSGGDLAGAQDALSEAYLAALRQWPVEGVPQNPEAWLTTVARRKLRDQQGRAKTRMILADQISSALDAAHRTLEADGEIPDERLKLMFACAHPGIDELSRTPLMLQTVLGLDAAHIASAFMVKPAAMSQRLVRTKAKILQAGIPFRIPSAEELPERLHDVLNAIYAAYTCSWGHEEPIMDGVGPLTEEAIWLARVTVQMLPGEPEAAGLLALMLFAQSRAGARLSSIGAYVPLHLQETRLWRRDLMHEAGTLLAYAARQRRPGRFQLEAAIQAVHASRADTGRLEWHAIRMLYEALVQLHPGLGASIGLAVAMERCGNPAMALQLLEGLPPDAILAHQPYWAARAEILRSLGRAGEAKQAYMEALKLTANPVVHDFLRGELSNVG